MCSVCIIRVYVCVVYAIHSINCSFSQFVGFFFVCIFNLTIDCETETVRHSTAANSAIAIKRTHSHTDRRFWTSENLSRSYKQQKLVLKQKLRKHFICLRDSFAAQQKICEYIRSSRALNECMCVCVFGYAPEWINMVLWLLYMPRAPDMESCLMMLYFSLSGGARADGKKNRQLRLAKAAVFFLN